MVQASVVMLDSSKLNLLKGLIKCNSISKNFKPYKITYLT